MSEMKCVIRYELLLVSVFFLSACSGENKNQREADPLSAIESAVLEDKDGFYYVNVADYDAKDTSLPIGVFDSGTGGLTVLDALVQYDQNNNEQHASGSDGKIDFLNEEFVYLADQANMPYGNYHKEKKSDLLKEHVLKDVQFLLGNRYYTNSTDKTYKEDKRRVKALVIACNTATAYGQEKIDEFIAKSKLDIPVIGVINAGSRGTLAGFGKDEDGAIGVFATVGTVASKGYENTILKMKKELGYTGDLQIYNQGGHGVAEAVDGERDFVDRKLTAPRKDYRGPSLSNADYKIEKTLMDVYNFDFDKSKMLCDTKNTDDCQNLQINSADNYVRYHLVSLMEKIRQNPSAKPLKALVLGCTHYPYLVKEIKSVFADLYNYKKDGKYVYRPFMDKDINIINPAEYVAKELYEALKSRESFNKGGQINNSEFYISVPNLDNKKVEVDENQRFTYAYKYGRQVGEIQEYVKVVPFSRNNISSDVTDRLNQSIPATFSLIKSFNAANKKVSQLPATERIQ